MTREEHLLATMAEEAAEVAHAVGKALRFGPDRIWPGTGKTNRQAIEDELAEPSSPASESSRSGLAASTLAISSGARTSGADAWSRRAGW